MGKLLQYIIQVRHRRTCCGMRVSFADIFHLRIPAIRRRLLSQLEIGLPLRQISFLLATYRGGSLLQRDKTKHKLCTSICFSVVIFSVVIGNTSCSKVDYVSDFKTSYGKKTEGVLNIVGPVEEKPAFDKLIECFNELYPKCQVTYTTPDNYEYSAISVIEDSEKVDLFITTNKMNINDASLSLCAKNLNELDIDLSSYDEGLLGECAINDRLVGLPLGISMNGFVVNKTLLTANELSVPKNYAVFADVCNALVKKEYTPVAGEGDNIYKNLFRDKWISDVMYLDDSENVIASILSGSDDCGEYLRDTFESVESFNGKKWTARTKNKMIDSTEAGIECFLQGDVAFLLLNSDDMSLFKDKLESAGLSEENKIEYCFIYLPVNQNGTFCSVESHADISMSSNAVNVEWAEEFLKFISGKKRLDLIASCMSVPSSAAADTKSTDSIYSYVNKLDRKYFMYSTWNMTDSKGLVTEVMDTLLQDIGKGKCSSTEAVNKMSGMVNGED